MKPIDYSDNITNLLGNVIRQAIEDYASKSTAIREDAEQWFYSDDHTEPNSKYPRLTFCWICDALGLDIKYMRKLVEKSAQSLRHRKRKKMSWTNVRYAGHLGIHNKKRNTT